MHIQSHFQNGVAGYLSFCVVVGKQLKFLSYGDVKRQDYLIIIALLLLFAIDPN